MLLRCRGSGRRHRIIGQRQGRGLRHESSFHLAEDPNLNVGRILIRMSYGGQSVPLKAIPESYKESLKSLPESREHAEDVLVYDNTADGKGHRLVARFIAGELVKTTHSFPEWLRSLFGPDLNGDVKQRERPSPGR